MKITRNEIKNISLYSGLGLFYAAVLFSLPNTLPVIIGSQDVANASSGKVATTNGTNKNKPIKQQVAGAALAQPNIAQAEENTNQNPNILAKAAYVFDATDSKVLFAKNENSALPLASLTKIMTAITAVGLAPETTEVVIPKEALAQAGDSGLLGDERWTLRDLLRYTLVVSSNDGAAAVALALGSTDESSVNISTRADFVRRMNERAQALGLSKTKFMNESGLDQDGDLAGAYGSAKDIATLLEYAVKNHQELVDATKYSQITVTSLDGIVHKAKNTDIIASKIPNLLAGKTGYTSLAGGNLAIAFKAHNGHTIIVVALGSTYDGRFNDVENLVTFSQTVISQNQ